MLFGIMEMDWRLRVCWLLVLRQVTVASGLCRVDVLWGRWFKDKPPYGGEGIRMEYEDVMDVESEGDSE